MRELQRKVRGFCEKHGLTCPLEFRFLDLVSELGELAKEMIKSSDYGKGEFKFRREIKEELGDVTFSLIVLANQLNVDLEEALNSAMEKYERRIKERGSPSSGRN